MDAGTAMSVPLSLRIVSKLLASFNRMARRPDYTINRWLADRMEIKVRASSKPVKGVWSHDVALDPTNKELWVRIFVPEQQDSDKKKLPLMIYYHGGGFAVLSPDFYLYDIFCRRLAKLANCIVVSAAYRRSPEHKYPAAHEDGFKVFEWLATTSEPTIVQHADKSRCFLSGDSAGGNIAYHVGVRAATEMFEGGNASVSVLGHILVQPFFGGVERTPAELRLDQKVPVISLENADWHWGAYLPKGEDRDHPVCNVFGPRSKEQPPLPDKFPPTMVVVGELDTLQDWQTRFVDELSRRGKQVKLASYKKGIHAFHIFNKYPLSRQVILDIAEFMSSQS